jgi:hypothetical protein
VADRRPKVAAGRYAELFDYDPGVTGASYDDPDHATVPRLTACRS